jgi:LysR family transcriptional regulator, nitrogen assimilation regulatory protein
MEIRQMAMLVAVCEEGSLSRAARRLGLAQPSLSVMMRDLERDLGVQLLERSVRGARPTAAGGAVYRRCLDILRDVDGLRAEVGAAAAGLTGEVRIGLPPTVACGILPGVLARFTRRWPQVAVRVAEGFSGTLLAWTASGEVDCAITAAASSDPRLIGRRLASEPLLLVRGRAGDDLPPAPPRGRPLGPAVRLAGGPALNVVLPSRHHALRGVLDGAIRAGRIPVARSIEIDSLPAMLGLVARSDWCTFLTWTAVAADRDAGRLAVAPLADGLPPLEFHLVHRTSKALSPAAERFVQMIAAEFDPGPDR